MPDRGAPSEFGGKVQRNGIQPPVSPSGMKGHTPDANEKLRLFYQTGQTEDSTKLRDGGETFSGLLPLKEQIAVAPNPEKYRDANS